MTETRQREADVGTAVQHFIITRFNLRLRGIGADKRGREVLTRSWLDERLDLFERYCLPSVVHQTEHRFTWLLLMNEDTDLDVRERIEGYRARMDGLEVAYLPPVSDDADLAVPARERLREETRVVVTTRLDNDDALHEEALAEIRRRVRGRREFLNLRLGFLTDGRRARVISHKYGSFATFIEPRSAEPVLTVYCGSHGRMRRIAPVRQIAGRPLWLRVIHARNVANAGFDEPRHFDFRTPRGIHRWFRRRVVGRVRRWTWPAAHRREYRLDEIAGAFHVGEIPAGR
ncbi:MAG TPA: glycosyltransferase [Longimicrobiales bacterium]